MICNVSPTGRPASKQQDFLGQLYLLYYLLYYYYYYYYYYYLGGFYLRSGQAALRWEIDEIS